MVAMYRGCCVASICLAKAELWNQGCVGGGEATVRRCVNCERFVEAGGAGRVRKKVENESCQGLYYQ
jgi:hypothetical protein